MYKPYYKKVDRSMMDWGMTIPLDSVNDFEAGAKVKPGYSRDITINWDNKNYAAKLSNVNRTGARPVYQVRWDNNKDLLNKIRKTFIQTYVVLKSEKEKFDITKKERKHFRTKLSGGQQEVLIATPINPKLIKFDVFIRIKSDWETLFLRLAEENVFGWLFDKNKKYLISRSVSWCKARDFKKHASVNNVIYYLANTKRKLLYVGKAEILGKRVKPGKQHQGMPGDWDLFKYDIVKSEYSNILERLEDHTIRSFASILKNNKNYPSLELSQYRLANSNWKKL